MPLMSRPLLLPDFVGQRPQAGGMAVANGRQAVSYVTASGPYGSHSDLRRGGERTMRAYITVTGIAVGLVALWAALVPLVA